MILISTQQAQQNHEALAKKNDAHTSRSWATCSACKAYFHAAKMKVNR